VQAKGTVLIGIITIGHKCELQFILPRNKTNKRRLMQCGSHAKRMDRRQKGKEGGRKEE
jgi:hypothetical protein